MMQSMTRADLRAFLERDWGLARRAKDEATGAFVRAHGATAAFRLAQALLDQTWSQVRHRRSDVSGLLAYTKLFDRVRSRYR